MSHFRHACRRSFAKVPAAAHTVNASAGLLLIRNGATEESCRRCGAHAAGVALPRRRRRAGIKYVSLALSVCVYFAIWQDTHAVYLSVHLVGYAHDGKTTYCWRIPAAYTVKQPQWKDDILSGSDKGCPISMTLNLASTEVTAGDFVAVNWTIKLEKDRFLNSSNTIHQGAIFRIMDESSRTLVDVIHSNVHSCEFGSNCDPFRQGDKFVDNTPNKVGNFSAAGLLVFTSQQELRYPTPGVYSVLAHIILPSSSNATNERFDYAVYSRLTVKEVVTKAPEPVASAAPAAAGALSVPSDSGIAGDSRAASSKGSGSKFSSGVIVGIVLGAVGVVAFVLVVAFFVHKRNAKHGPRALSPFVGHQLRPLRQKSTFNDGYSSDASIPVLGRQRLGAAPQANGVPTAYSDYLASESPHHAAVRGSEMNIRDFDNTVDEDENSHDTSYPFVPRGSTNDRRSHQIVDSSAYSVDFIYGNTNQSDELLLQQMRRRQHSDEYRSEDENSYDDDAGYTNDSYTNFIDGETTRSDRVFSSASEASASTNSERHYEEFGERLSDLTDPHEAEL